MIVLFVFVLKTNVFFAFYQISVYYVAGKIKTRIMIDPYLYYKNEQTLDMQILFFMSRIKIQSHFCIDFFFSLSTKCIFLVCFLASRVIL